MAVATRLSARPPAHPPTAPPTPPAVAAGAGQRHRLADQRAGALGGRRQAGAGPPLLGTLPVRTLLPPPSPASPTPAQVLGALATAVLPGLALKLFIQLLPALLGAINRRAGARRAAAGGQRGRGPWACQAIEHHGSASLPAPHWLLCSCCPTASPRPGMVSEGEIDLAVTTRFFAFQVGGWGGRAPWWWWVGPQEARRTPASPRVPRLSLPPTPARWSPSSSAPSSPAPLPTSCASLQRWAGRRRRGGRGWRPQHAGACVGGASHRDPHPAPPSIPAPHSVTPHTCQQDPGSILTVLGTAAPQTAIL